MIFQRGWHGTIVHFRLNCAYTCRPTCRPNAQNEGALRHYQRLEVEQKQKSDFVDLDLDGKIFIGFPWLECYNHKIISITSSWSNQSQPQILKQFDQPLRIVVVTFPSLIPLFPLFLLMIPIYGLYQSLVLFSSLCTTALRAKKIADCIAFNLGPTCRRFAIAKKRTGPNSELNRGPYRNRFKP